MILVEACCGTAALTFSLFGQKPPVPMAGSKRTLASQIHPFLGPGPWTEAWLNDPGEWGQTWTTLFGPYGWNAVADVLLAWDDRNDRRLFDDLRTAPPDSNPIRRAAAHLFLQSRTYRGRPVYPLPDGTGWRTHGFDPEFRMAKTKASGAKDRGWFNARPTIARKLQALAQVDWPPVRVTRLDARDLAPVPEALLYLDPPYRCSPTMYGNTLDRPAVLDIARAWAAAGARVVISEAEPIDLGPDWISAPLRTRRVGTQLAVHQEWVTSQRQAPPRRDRLDEAIAALPPRTSEHPDIEAFRTPVPADVLQQPADGAKWP